jgi:hypothetical protein
VIVPRTEEPIVPQQNKKDNSYKWPKCVTIVTSETALRVCQFATRHHKQGGNLKIYGQSSRRTRRILGVTLVSLLSFAAACGGDSSSDETSAPTESGAPETSDAPVDEAPVAGGTLRVGLEADVDGLDPTASALAVSGLTMAAAVFDPLFTFTADDKVVPYLAESIEPSADFMVWTMTLRADVVFHD